MSKQASSASRSARPRACPPRRRRAELQALKAENKARSAEAEAARRPAKRPCAPEIDSLVKTGTKNPASRRRRARGFQGLAENR